jgi:hypothetical protein
MESDGLETGGRRPEASPPLGPPSCSSAHSPETAHPSRPSFRHAPARCTHCPPGSHTASSALPLELDGLNSRVLAELIGVQREESFCPHCAAFALQMIGRYRAKKEGG